MKLKVRYPTKELRYISEYTYQNVSKTAELEPLKIVRHPCGVGAAASRYVYWAYFVAPEDAEFAVQGFICKPIDRKLNKRFNPKAFEFLGDVWKPEPNNNARAGVCKATKY